MHEKKKKNSPVGAGVGAGVGLGVGAGVGGSIDGARVPPMLAGGAVKNSVGDGVGTGGLVSPGAWAAASGKSLGEVGTAVKAGELD